MKQQIFIKFIVCSFIASLTSSCVSYKQVGYLQDMTESSQIELENKIEATISSGDLLSIIVSSYDEEIAKPFNVLNSNTIAGGSGTNGNQNRGYLVSVDGNIEFPVLGDIHVAGLTRLQLQNKIKQMLIDGGYISEPFVYVRFSNFKIFFLGANGGKSISVDNEHCTFLEALALSGDLDQYTKRDKIAVMREVDGKMTMRYLDPRSSKVFNDPYFVLQQNDMIITQSIGGKYVMNETQYWMSWVAIASSIASTVTTIILVDYTVKK